MANEIEMKELEEIPVPEDEAAEPRLTAPDPDETADELTEQQASTEEN